jgi:hypothetical protein
VLPLHGVPDVCTRHPFELEVVPHVTGVDPLHVVPAGLHWFVQHVADPAAP